MSHKKFGPDRFSRFDIYGIQTDRQTPKQTDKPNLYRFKYLTMKLKKFIDFIQKIFSLNKQNIFKLGNQIKSNQIKSNKIKSNKKIKKNISLSFKRISNRFSKRSWYFLMANKSLFIEFIKLQLKMKI